MECGVSRSREGGGGGRGGSSSVQRRQQQPSVMRHVSPDADGGFVGASAMADLNPSPPIVPQAGTVNQVCRKWGVYEDEVYAYKLQEKEIEMHYGKNREVRHLVRSDLKQAKDLQLEERTEAHCHERSAQTLELQDEMLARKLQQQLHGEVSASIKALELADKEMAKNLQKLESRRDVDGFDRRLHRPHKGKASASSSSSTSSSPHRGSGRHEHRPITVNSHDVSEEHSIGRSPSASTESAADRPRRRVENVPEVSNSSKRLAKLTTVVGERPPPPGNAFNVATKTEDDECLRLLQEEEDAKLARLLQEEESLRKSRDYRDQQLAIEAQDRELAKLLQEQERSKARRARLKSHNKPRSTDQLLLSDPSDHHTLKDDDVGNRRSSAVKTRTYPPMSQASSSSSSSSSSTHNDPLKTSSTGERGGMDTGAETRPVRPTKLSVSSSYSSHDSRLEPGPRHREVRTPHSDNGNVATVIDPTYRRSNHKHGHGHGYLQEAGSPSPVLPTPMSLQSDGVYPAEDDGDEYDELNEDHAPPYMPIQGQKRPPTLEKRKKKENCKQQ